MPRSYFFFSFKTVFTRITKALVPDFDVTTAESMLAQDWEADNGGTYLLSVDVVQH